MAERTVAQRIQEILAEQMQLKPVGKAPSKRRLGLESLSRRVSLYDAKGWLVTQPDPIPVPTVVSRDNPADRLRKVVAEYKRGTRTPELVTDF